MPNLRLTSSAFALLLLLAPWASGQIPAPLPKNGYELDVVVNLMPDSPTGLTVGDLGEVYCLTNGGRIYRLDPPFDVAQTPTLWFDGSLHFTPFCTALTWHGGKIYVAHQSTVSTVEDLDADGSGDTVTDIITGLPWAGDHQNNQIVFDDSGTMYFGIGSQNDHTADVNPVASTIVSADADGTNLQVHATGIRNAFGLAWHPDFGLFATENAPNSLPGDPNPPDEINLIEAGQDYGYPGYYGEPPSGSGTKGPVMPIPAHAAPTGIAIDGDRVWSGFGGELYVCLFNALAGAILRTSIDQDPVTGAWQGFYEPVATGFFNALDCVMTPQGDLLACDFVTRKIVAIRPKDSSRMRFSGIPRVGELVGISLCDPESAGDVYVAALSTSEYPGAVVPDGRVFWMDIASDAFTFTTTPGNGVLEFPGGYLDGDGCAAGYLYVPEIPELAGLSFWAGWVSVDPLTLEFGAVSETLRFEVLP